MKLASYTKLATLCIHCQLIIVAQWARQRGTLQERVAY